MSLGILRNCGCGQCEKSPISFCIHVQKTIPSPHDYFRYGGTYESGGFGPWRLTNASNIELDYYLRETIEYTWCDASNNPQSATVVTEINRWYAGNGSLSSLTTSCDGLVYEFTLAKDASETSYLNPALYTSGVYTGSSPCLTSSGGLGFGNGSYMSDCAGHTPISFSAVTTILSAATKRIDLKIGATVVATAFYTLSVEYTADDFRADFDEIMALFDMASINATSITLDFGDNIGGPSIFRTFGRVDDAQVWVITVIPDKNGKNLIGGQRFIISGTPANPVAVPPEKIEQFLTTSVAGGQNFTPISGYFYIGNSDALTVRGFCDRSEAVVAAGIKSWINDDVPSGKLVLFPQDIHVDPVHVDGYVTCGSLSTIFLPLSTKPDPICIGVPSIASGGQELPMPTFGTKGWYFMEGVGVPLCASPC